jgi:colicin import membrane protein
MMAVTYREPYQFSAGVLALLVHGVFFSVLYFGFSWQTQPVMESMNVELWDGLPAGAPAIVAPTVILPPAPTEIVAPAPVAEVKPDIVVPDKQKTAQKPVLKPTHEVKKSPETRKPTLLERYGIEGGTGSGTGARPATRGQQQAQREQSAKQSETDRIIAEYVGKIRNKIKGNVIVPPDVAFDARVRFSVTVLPDGTVLSPRLIKSSGQAVYDAAVERAILKSQPLPLPHDSELFGNFRELNLCFSPFKEELCR